MAIALLIGVNQLTMMDKGKDESPLNEEKVKLPFQGENINFLTVTRLVEQKAIDRIIRVHKRLIQNGFFHNFYVIGDGPERGKIQRLIKENQLIT